MKRLRIAVLTGTRADYGLFRPLLDLLEMDPVFDVGLIVTGSHLSPRFGATVTEIERDGRHIVGSVPLDLDDDSELGVTRAAAAALAGVAEQLHALRPHLLVLLGDRFETFAAAAAALLARIPIAHLHGGELSRGAADDAMRHAITKLSWLHFPATKRSAQRIVQLGEDPRRIFVVGALGVDNALHLRKMTKCELEAELGPVFGPQTAVVTFHPVTLEERTAGAQMAELLTALDRLPTLHAVFTMPNADADNQPIATAIEQYCSCHPDRMRVFTSLGSARYLSLLKLSQVCIGNSSSGIIEAPSLGTPSVDIGDRQGGRERGPSVLHCEPEAATIAAAIHHALSPATQRLAAARENPYGDGHAAERIVAILREHAEQLGPLKKGFHDIPGVRVAGEEDG